MAMPLRRSGLGRSRRSIRLRRLAVEPLECRRLLTSALTPHEQLLLEMVNRARAEPAAEARRLGIDLNAGLSPGTISPEPKPPLAPHPLLLAAAGRHAQDMLDRDYFEHETPEGLRPTDRAAAQGYVGRVAENIAYGGSTGTINQIAQVAERHDNLFRSSGHRTILLGGFREVGPAIRYGRFTTDGLTFNVGMVAQKFGVGNQAYLTGVAFSDTVVRDRFYSVGEGLSDIVVTATSAAGTGFTTTTGPSGGYALPLPDGGYSVVFSRGGQATAAVPVSIGGGRNEKLDFMGVFAGGGDPPPPPPQPFAALSVQQPPAGTYGVGSTLVVSIVFSGPARVSGRPSLPLVVGGRTVSASFAGGSGTDTLHFRYQVGRSISSPEVRLGTTIRSHSRITAADGSRLPATLPAGIAGASLGGVSIDTLPPKAIGAVVVPESRVYAAGEPLRFTVAFDEPLVVGGMPVLTINVGPSKAAVRNATYVSSSPDGRSLTFEYVVQAGDGSPRGWSPRVGRSIGGGTLTDAAGNAAVRKISVPATKGIRIAGFAPAPSVAMTFARD